MVEPIGLAVTESSQVGEARRLAVALALRLGFDESGRGKVALVATEAATNLVKHAREGELILRPLERGAVGGLEVLALDKGPGMADLGRCLRDGYSTAGSPGNGLGAIDRLGDDLVIHSMPGIGTALVVRLWSAPPPSFASGPRLEVGAVCLPMAGEAVCGDAWATVEQPGRALVMIADGLGHGPLAAEAARAAVRIFLEQAGTGPVQIVRAAHAALKSTRGAVMAVAAIDFDAGTVRYVGVGNIAAAVLVPGESRSMVSQNGTVGHEVRKIQEFLYAWPPAALLVMHSDGLATQWRLDRYGALFRDDPALVAGVLYRDFKRARDDVTVVVARRENGEDES